MGNMVQDAGKISTNQKNVEAAREAGLVEGTMTSVMPKTFPQSSLLVEAQAHPEQDIRLLTEGVDFLP